MSEIKAGNPEQVWDGVFPAASKNSAFSGGTGTIGDPYIIATPLNFAQLSADVAAGTEYPNTYFELGNDIGLNLGAIDPTLVNPAVPGPSGYPQVSGFPVYEWIPVGGADAVSTDPKLVHTFQGHFDGAGHTISNAFYNHQVVEEPAANEIEHDPVNKLNAVGLFGALGSHATVKNLNTAGGYFGACNSVGGIVGRNWGGEITNCHNGNFIYATGSQGTGGVTGASWVYKPEAGSPDPEKAPKIDKCTNSGTIISNYTNRKGERSGAAGGIVGENEGSVTNSSNTGTISALRNAAGIVGSNQDSNSTGEISIVPPGKIENCYSAGDIGITPAYGVNDSIPAITADCVGGIIGFQTGGCVNVYAVGVIACNVGKTAGQIIGQMKTATAQVNDYLNAPVSALVVGDDTGSFSGLGENVFTYTGDDAGKDELFGNLQTWVDEVAASVVYNWTRDEGNIINQGYPVFDI